MNEVEAVDGGSWLGVVWEAGGCGYSWVLGLWVGWLEMVGLVLIVDCLESGVLGLGCPKLRGRFHFTFVITHYLRMYECKFLTFIFGQLL
jgi:hypothetical protein